MGSEPWVFELFIYFSQSSAYDHLPAALPSAFPLAIIPLWTVNRNNLLFHAKMPNFFVTLTAGYFPVVFGSSLDAA